MHKVMDVSAADFQKTVLENSLPVGVIFYSNDCPVCASVLPLFERMAQIYEGKILFTRINRDFNRGLSKQYHVKASSTILFFSQGKEVCRRLSGYIRTPELRCALESITGGNCDCPERDKVECDVLILGGGPAGLTAAIYAARAKFYTVVVDDSFIGGQVATTWQVANYPGTNGVIRGVELVGNMKRQALDFGAQIDDMQEITDIRLDGPLKILTTKTTEYAAKSVIIATGAHPRKLNIEGEEAFTGRGVHYCATCDAALYQDAHVMVVGGGDSAVEEAVFLTRYAKKVTVVHRRDTFRASGAAQAELFKSASIEVLFNREVVAIHGENFVTSVTLRDVHTKQTQQMPIDGIFIYIGMQPMSKLFEGQLALDENGYIVTDDKLRTSREGVFAAGDVRFKEVRQITTAVGDGAVAAIMAGRYLSEIESTQSKGEDKK